MAIFYECFSETGKVREMNQDSVFGDVKGESGIFAVADGMGGHSRGELASRRVTELLGEWWKRNYPLFASRMWEENLMSVEKLFFEINNDIVCMYRRLGITGGTTLSLVVIQGKKFAVISVGDSRVYHMESRKLRQVSRDDIWEKLEENVCVPQEILQKDFRYGTLTQAVGYDEILTPRVFENKLAEGDIIFLCSDGVYKYLAEKTLKRIIRRNYQKKYLGRALKKLRHKINSAGAADNFSAVIVKNE